MNEEETTPAPAPPARPMPWYAVILVRAARAGLAAFSGMFTANGLGIVDFGGVSQLKLAAAAGLSAAAWSLVQNALELLAKLDQSAPGLRG